MEVITRAITATITANGCALTIAQTPLKAPPKPATMPLSFVNTPPEATIAFTVEE